MADSGPIVLINYPYGEFDVDDECDFGEEINKSLVSQQRAVWKDERLNPPLVVKSTKSKVKVNEEAKEEVQLSQSEVKSDQPAKDATAKPKKLLQNKLQAEVKKTSGKESKNFWDRLK